MHKVKGWNQLRTKVFCDGFSHKLWLSKAFVATTRESNVLVSPATTKILLKGTIPSACLLNFKFNVFMLQSTSPSFSILMHPSPSRLHFYTTTISSWTSTSHSFWNLFCSVFQTSPTISVLPLTSVSSFQSFQNREKGNRNYRNAYFLFDKSFCRHSFFAILHALLDLFTCKMSNILSHCTRVLFTFIAILQLKNLVSSCGV